MWLEYGYCVSTLGGNYIIMSSIISIVSEIWKMLAQQFSNIVSGHINVLLIYT